MGGGFSVLLPMRLADDKVGGRPRVSIKGSNISGLYGNLWVYGIDRSPPLGCGRVKSGRTAKNTKNYCMTILEHTHLRLSHRYTGM